MRFETAGELRRVDLASIIDVLPALRDEWAGLRFDRDGRLINPLTGDTVAALTLLDGRHRQPGAVYRLTVTSPKLELPEERRAEFEKEARKLSKRNAKQERWNDHFARRRKASVRVGTEEERFAATLREDNARRLAFSLSHEDDHWTVDVVVDHGRLPKVELNGHVDLTASFKADGTPGFLASILGGTGGGTAVVDLRTFERGGPIVDAEARANRFRGSARLEVRTSATRWAVSGDGTLRARGLGLPVLWFAGRRVRRSVDRSLAEFWASSESQMGELEKELSGLRTGIEDEGGPAPFVLRALWDKDFDPGSESLRRGRGES
jgi:hypothetical protein